MQSPLDGLNWYGYDNKYQLVHVDYPQGYFTPTATFNHDPVGNRYSVSTPAGSLQYVSNRLNQYRSVAAASYQYDSDGNLTNDGVNSYEYDSENQLVKVDTPAQTIRYSYDYKGRRIAKDVDGKATKYVYGGVQILCEYAVVGDSERLIRKFIYGPGVDEPICMTSYTCRADLNEDNTVDTLDAGLLAAIYLKDEFNPEYVADYDLSGDGVINNADSDIVAAAFGTTRQAAVYWYHFDGLGSVIALTDAAGQVVETYQYDVYGRVQIRSADGVERRTGQYGNRYLFTGREYDAESGLYYYRARMYNPAIGRFMQTDPVGYDDGINWYAYCGNNPLIFVDPWGLCSNPSYYSNLGFGDIIKRDALRAVAWYSGNYAQSIANTFQGIQDTAIGMVNFSTVVGYHVQNGYSQGAADYFAPSPQWARDRYWKQSDFRFESQKFVSTFAVGWGISKLFSAPVAATKAGRVGSYTHEFESGKKYAGKGPQSRAAQSAKKLSNEYNDPLKKTDWTPSSSSREAFKDEARRLEKIGGPGDRYNYNKIESPGKKYIEQDGF